MNYKELEKIYKVLANKRRLAILDFLASTNKASVGDIARKIKLSFRSTSKHLQILKGLDMVDSEQIGLEYKYYLNENNKHVRQALRYV